MNIIERVELNPNTNEEILPDYSNYFPYILSRVELDRYPERSVPWHWHNALELFYLVSGELEYYTPGGTKVFTAGMGGLVNSNVLHMTKLKPDIHDNVQLIHLFDPVFISGGTGKRIDQKYLMPFITNPQIELIDLHPEDSAQKHILDMLRSSFDLKPDVFGYEIHLRERIAQIWLELIKLINNHDYNTSVHTKTNSQIKAMMIYIQEHFHEKISIEQLADIAFLSKRSCYRIFQEQLHMTPVEYIRSYRLQMACQMLTKGDSSLIEISQACGFGSSSYFGKIFKEQLGCTPAEYKTNWHNCNT